MGPYMDPFPLVNIFYPLELELSQKFTVEIPQ